MKILVVSNVSEIDRTYGSGVILGDFLDWFSSEGAEVHLVSASKFSARNFARRLAVAKVPAGTRELLPGFWRIGNTWFSLSPKIWFAWFIEKLGINRGRESSADYKYDQIMVAEDAIEMAKLSQKENYDVVIADYVWCAPVLAAIHSQAICKGIIAHDIMQNRISSMQKSGSAPDVSEEVAARELQLLGSADFVCVETSDDKAFIQERIPRMEIFLMPRAVLVQAHPTPSDEKFVLFIGGAAQHNVQGIAWFLKQVWPHILLECKTARLRILGAVAHTVTVNHQNVDLVGPVPDSTPFYQGSTVCIIPLLSGSGFKTKLIEALAFGKACVSTPVGAAGLPPLLEPPLIVVEEANQFAVAVSAFLKDDELRRTYELRSADYIQKFHSPNAVYSPILEYLNHVHSR
jgi:glycosyltransferase involved in cell wall biosynthesis